MSEERRLPEGESDDLYMKDPKAKSVAGFIEALGILAKYMKAGVDTAHFSAAEHDVFYVSTDYAKDGDYEAEPAENSEDGRRLVMLGWHFDGETDGWAYST